MIHQQVLNNLSSDPDIFRTVCSSCKTTGIWWDENMKAKDGDHFSIFSWVSFKGQICRECGRKMRVAPTTVMEIEEDETDRANRLLRKKINLKKLERDKRMYLGDD